VNWKVPLLLVLLVLALLLGSCSIYCAGNDAGSSTVPGEKEITGRIVHMTTTGYCPCGICCSWKTDWRGRTVSKLNGKPKVVGQTASGTRAKPGTIAADPRYYPFGTILYVPGYGYGRVEDTGGDIKGRGRLDLFFHTHEEAKKWGRKSQRVVVFPVGTPLIPKDAPSPM
jgi:3D (Asp-Asp-Asp) domain-containing protein